MLKNKSIVFDKYWFNKHQKSLLWLANSWLGEFIFGFKKMGHYLVKDKPVVRITPESVHQLLGFRRKITTHTGKQKRGILRSTFQAQFFGNNIYARRLYFILYPIWLMMHFWDWLVADRFMPELSFGFSTLTANPVSGANSPCDGYVEYYASLTWATARDAATGTSASVTTTGPLVLCSRDAADGYYLDRGFLNFDTSSLGSGATISAAVFSIAGTGVTKSDTDSTDIDVVSATPAGTNTLTTADYDQVGSTPFASMAINSYVTTAGTYNDFTLDANGIANISKTGISKFGLRIARDTDNVAPSFTGNNRITYRAADFGTEPPKLVITYSTVTTFARTASASVSRAVSRTINVSKITNFIRSLSVSVSRAASRTITIARIANFLRTASASVSRAASRTITVISGFLWTRTASASVSNAASRFATVSRIFNLVRSATVSVSISASRTITIARVVQFIKTVSATVSNAASRLATVARATNYTRGLSASVSNSVGRLATILAKLNGQFISAFVKLAKPIGDNFTKLLKPTNDVFSKISKPVSDLWNKFNKPQS